MQLAPTIAYHHLTVDDYHKLGEVGILMKTTASNWSRGC